MRCQCAYSTVLCTVLCRVYDATMLGLRGELRRTLVTLWTARSLHAVHNIGRSLSLAMQTFCAREREAPKPPRSGGRGVLREKSCRLPSGSTAWCPIQHVASEAGERYLVEHVRTSTWCCQGHLFMNFVLPKALFLVIIRRFPAFWRRSGRDFASWKNDWSYQSKKKKCNNVNQKT
jgi:hypothetical protein